MGSEIRRSSQSNRVNSKSIDSRYVHEFVSTEVDPTQPHGIPSSRSVIDGGVLRILSDVEPRRAVGEGKLCDLDANTVSDILAQCSVRMVEERGHALAHTRRACTSEGSDDVAGSNTSTSVRRSPLRTKYGATGAGREDIYVPDEVLLILLRQTVPKLARPVKIDLCHRGKRSDRSTLGVRVCTVSNGHTGTGSNYLDWYNLRSTAGAFRQCKGEEGA